MRERPRSGEDGKRQHMQKAQASAAVAVHLLTFSTVKLATQSIDTRLFEVNQKISCVPSSIGVQYLYGDWRDPSGIVGLITATTSRSRIKLSTLSF